MIIAICDDEPICIRELTDILHKLLPTAAIQTYQSGASLLSDKDFRLFDIIFLDIAMPGLDGFETAERLRMLSDKQCLVFVTSLEDQMRRGYDFDASDYIVKPATEEHLRSLLDRIQKKMKRKRLPDIEIKTIENLTIMVPPAEIQYLEAIPSHRIRIVTSKQTHEYIGNLDDAEKRFASIGFVRTHRSYIVNMAYIFAVDNDHVLLNNNTRVPVSRNRLQSVKQSCRDYRRENKL